MSDKYVALWEGILHNVELTTKNLREIGYSKPKVLIDANILRRIKIGHYELANLIEFFNYGMQFKDVDNEKYYEIMLKCEELDGSFGSAIFQLFVYGLRKKDYNTSFNYLVKLMNLNNPQYQKDYNLYLLLLSRIIKLPEEYQEKVQNLNVFDIYAPNSDKRFKNRNMENQIRKAFFDGNYDLALKLSKRFFNDGYPKIVYFQLLKCFIKKDKNKTISILNLVKEHQYSALKEHLDELKELSSKNKTLKTLVDAYLEILNTREIPEVKPYKGRALDILILANDFKAALDLINSNPLAENSLMRLALIDINDLINKVREEENKVYTFNDVILTLVNKGNYLYVIKKFLEQNNKAQYEKLLLSFINLGLYEDDLGFMTFSKYLYDLIYNELSIDFSKYHSFFIQAIQDKAFEEAKLYLNIIRAGNELQLNSIDINSLEYSLDNEERKYKREHSLALISKSIDEVINSKSVVLIDKKDINVAVLEEFVDKYPNIILEQKGDIIFLRYFKHTYIDIVNVNEDIKFYYKNGDYKACINSAMGILNCVSNVKDHIYQFIGLSYYYLGNLKEAKKFLTIANLTDKYDNTRLISIIDEKLKEEEVKRELKPEA